ncbi:MAG: type II CAAX endopeptidase family protein [Myxococcota bacterium]
MTTPRWTSPRAIATEQVVLWLLTLLLIRAVVMINQAGVHEIVLALVPVLFMYMPVLACNLRGADSWSYPLALPAFRDSGPWLEALKLNAMIIGVVAVPFVVLYHFWQTRVFGFEFEGTLPSQPLMLIGYHLFFVAIPEEMFYRGYMQSRFDELWEPRWNVLGAKLGPGLLVTCVLFAFGHSIVQVQWWHFAIIVPSLAFGWLRTRTDNIIAGAFFHAWCNITVAFLDTAYGIIEP